jgi:hypothetical protein
LTVAKEFGFSKNRTGLKLAFAHRTAAKPAAGREITKPSSQSADWGLTMENTVSAAPCRSEPVYASCLDFSSSFLSRFTGQTVEMHERYKSD